MPHPKDGKKSIGFLDAEFYPESLEKNLLEKNKYCRSSPNPENSWCGHQQPYSLF